MKPLTLALALAMTAQAASAEHILLGRQPDPKAQQPAAPQAPAQTGGLTTPPEPPSPVALLLPAIQAAREAPRRNR